MIIEMIMYCIILLAHITYIVLDVIYITALLKDKSDQTMRILDILCICFSTIIVISDFFFTPFLWKLYFLSWFIDVCLFILHLLSHHKTAKR